MRRSLRELLESDEGVGLVVQGGGMRGAYSIAALDQLAQFGYSERFSDIWATSAGALNGAYFLSGQTEIGITAYTEHLSSRRFIDPWRLSKVIDIDFLVDAVLKEKVPLDEAAMLGSSTSLHTGVFSTGTGSLEWKHSHALHSSIFEVFRAAAALPIVYGREVPLGDDTYVDGGLVQSVPIPYASEQGVENLLVIATRPRDFQPKVPSKLYQLAIRLAARAKGHSESVIQRLGIPDVELNEAMTAIRRGTTNDGQVKVWAITPGREIVSRLTKDRSELEDTVAIAQADVAAALSGRLGAHSA